MIDLALLRAHPETVRAALKAKNAAVDLDAILKVDADLRKTLVEIERLNAESKTLSAEVGRMMKATKRDPADISKQSTAILQSKQVKARVKELEAQLRPIEEERDALILTVPNVPAADVPVAADDSGNAIVRSWGPERTYATPPKAHWDVAKDLELIDFERGGKISGSGFPVYRGLGARLQRALINFMMDLHSLKHGYTEIWPPDLVNRNSMTGTGQLPKFENEMYRLKDEDLFLIPTAEVPVTNLHRDEILPADRLPVRYVAYSACFRREAGAAGRDTRGIIRIHQFDKVELVKFVRPETSHAELESLVADAEEVLQMLDLRYRVKLLCTGDMSFASAKTYDLELWGPGCNQWLEVSSCSTFTDFQARRAAIRFRDTDGKVRFVHTLNGSGVALPRLVIAILEQLQEPDGRVRVPDALRVYLDGLQWLSR